jgi:Zn-dependent M28 family amino/carboxypeptidase
MLISRLPSAARPPVDAETPGANENGSDIAATLEPARAVR